MREAQKHCPKMIGPRWRAMPIISLKGRCFINGEYVDAADGGKIEVINPATSNEVCGTCAAGNEKDIDKAVAAAKESFKAKTWRKMAPRKRMGIMMKFADLLQATAELALMDSMNG